MAALPNNNPTLLDLANAMDPDGSIAAVVEILSQQHGLLDVMTWQEGNLPTGHRSVVRAGIPVPTWRKLYGYVTPTKSERVAVTDDVGQLAAYIEVDEDLANLSGNPAQFMLSESRAQLEGFKQELESTLWFGNSGSEPEAFTGLGPRFNSTTAANGENIILGGSVDTDNASMWVVVFHPDTVFGIIPKGSKAGFSLQDLGVQTIDDGSGGRMQAYRTYMTWKAGLAVRDWRAIVRVPNIDRSLLNATGTGSSAVLPDLLFQAIDQIPDGIISMGRPAIFMDRSIRTKLRQQMSNKVANSTLSFTDVGGRKVMDFQGIPIMVSDALRANESLIT